MNLSSTLAVLGVATVYEASGKCGLINAELIQILPGSRAAGPARTVLCGQDDNLSVHLAMEQLQSGEVLVVSMPEARPIALIGELLAIQAKARGAAALLVDAAIRDREELVSLGLPIWARWVRVAGATKATTGTINVPVTLSGATIHPGDIVVLDADGAVVVEAAKAGFVTEASLGRDQKEGILRPRLRNGELTLDLMQLRP